MDFSSTLPPLRPRATVLAAVAATGALFAAGLATATTQASPSGDTYPAKLQVLRAGVSDGRLDVLAGMTKRADGDRVRVSFMANGKRSGFTAPVEDGRIRFKRLLPAAQRHMSTGIMEIHYEGNDRVRPTQVRLRAANGKARLQRDLISLHNGVITAEGSLADRSDGVVRLILSYARHDGTVGEWQGRAPIRDDGSWRLEEDLPTDARSGGYLSIQYTGYHPRRVRGEQLAKELLDGQTFGVLAKQTKRNKKTKPAPVIESPPPPVSEPAPAPVSEPAPAPVSEPAPGAGKLTEWRAVGSAPLSDAEAAARVTVAPEVRPGNETYNRYRPSDSELAAFHGARYETGANAGVLADDVIPQRRHVTGRFTGTTDEILQWAAHKWGIPEDILRAVAHQESTWYQSARGDRKTVADASLYPAHSRISATEVYESLGLMQIKWRPNGSMHPGTEPLRWKSTAFNADYYGAQIRFFYDGHARSWFSDSSSYGPGQAWESVGAWYQPTPWLNAGQLAYIDGVRAKVDARTWTGF